MRRTGAPAATADGKASLRLRWRRWLRCDGLHRIRPRALFEPRVQGRRRVELSTTEKPLQDGRALARVDIRRNPGVLGANLALVLGKTRRRRTQDGEVDIDQKRGVGRRGRRRVAGRHDEVVDAPASVRIEACRIERLHGPLRRTRLVIVGMHVIDGVVEPQRQFDCMGMLRLGVQFLEQRKAFFEMLQHMVVALRLGPGKQQALEQSTGWAATEHRPRRTQMWLQRIHDYSCPKAQCLNHTRRCWIDGVVVAPGCD